MKILDAYDLTGSLRDAGELAGCSHHTVKHYVERRAAAGVLDKAAARLDYDAALMIADRIGAAARGEEDETFGGADGRHLEVGLPRTAEFAFPEMLVNGVIESCVRELLGPAFVRYWCGNCACPGSGVQPLHQDGGGWSVGTPEEAAAAGVAWPHPAYKLSVNFGVDEMVPENGSTVSPPAARTPALPLPLRCCLI